MKDIVLAIVRLYVLCCVYNTKQKASGQRNLLAVTLLHLVQRVYVVINCWGWPLEIFWSPPQIVLIMKKQIISGHNITICCIFYITLTEIAGLSIGIKGEQQLTIVFTLWYSARGDPTARTHMVTPRSDTFSHPVLHQTAVSTLLFTA